MNADEPITDIPDSDEETAKDVMITKTYSEQVKVTPEGALNEIRVRSKCVYSGSQHYKTSVECVPRIVPIHHVNTVVTDGEEVTYKDCIFFSIRMKPRSYSESVFSHGKRLQKRYRTTFTHCDNYKRKSYVVGLEIAPAMRLIAPKQSVQYLPICKENSELVNGLLNGIDCEVTVM